MSTPNIIDKGYYWLDEKGERISHGIIAPGRRKESSSQANRIWVLESKEGTSVFITPPQNSVAVYA